MPQISTTDPDAAVQVGEVPDTPSHVVRGAAIELPSLEHVVIRAVTEESLRARLDDVSGGVEWV
jgi:hypothetical protein